MRLLRSPLVSRGRTRAANVFCFSILPMVMSRYEFCPLPYGRGNATAAKTKGEIVMNNFHRPATPVRVRCVPNTRARSHQQTLRQTTKQPHATVRVTGGVLDSPSRGLVPRMFDYPFLIFVSNSKIIIKITLRNDSYGLFFFFFFA